VGDNDQQPRHDPLGDVINLFAAPIAGGIRSVEQFRRGIDELFRTIDNLNNTLETINEAAARVNRFMSDIEEPVRAILPQLTRTVQAADELIEVVSGPARRITPNLVQIADTLGSPAFTTLPNQLSEFMKVMSDVSRRLGPLAQFAESAGGMFGFRLPGSSRSAQRANEPTPLPATAEPFSPNEILRTALAKTSTPSKTTARKTSKKTSTKKTPARKVTARKTPARKTTAKQG
jgi:ABC-type transporter Mla subunit MlaD